MWIRISKIAKTISFSTQTEVEIFQKLIPAKPCTIIVENTENSPNSSSCTIDCKSVRNSHLLFQKFGIFSSATSIALYTKRKFLTRKVSKQQLTALNSIVKRYMAKCYKHAPISSKHTIVVTGVSKATNIHIQNTIYINLANIVITIYTYQNGSFFSYKKQRLH